MAGQYRAGTCVIGEPKGERIGARKIFALRLDGVSNGQPSNIPGNSTPVYALPALPALPVLLALAGS